MYWFAEAASRAIAQPWLASNAERIAGQTAAERLADSGTDPVAR